MSLTRFELFLFLVDFDEKFMFSLPLVSALRDLARCLNIARVEVAAVVETVDRTSAHPCSVCV